MKLDKNQIIELLNYLLKNHQEINGDDPTAEELIWYVKNELERE